MEVKPSYKQTEVGVLPDDWDVRLLGEFAQFRNGLNFIKSDKGDIVKVVGVSDFQSNFSINEDHLDSVQIAGSIGTDDLLKNDDLLFVRSNGSKALIGRCVLIRGFNQPVSFSGFTIRGRVSRAIANPEYIGRYFHSKPARRQIKEAGEGSHISNLSQQVLESLRIPLPELAEQEAIAGALSDADALIESLEQLVAKKRQIKHGAMQQLLTGQKRLPGFTGEWETKRLGEGITLDSGHHILAQHCNTQHDGMAYLTGPADFPDGRIQHTKFTTRPGTICTPRDILVTVKGSGSGTIVLADAHYCISRQLMAIRVTDWDSDFIYFSLLQNACRFKAASTGLIPGLSRSDILDQTLPFPSTVHEQTAIAAVLSDMDTEIAGLEAKLAKARQVRQGMMQELLTGRIRLV